MPMAIRSATVLLDVVLAPVSIAGWGTGHPLGTAGAGLASSIAAIIGTFVFSVLFSRLEMTLRLRVA